MLQILLAHNCNTGNRKNVKRRLVVKFRSLKWKGEKKNSNMTKLKVSFWLREKILR